MNGEGPRKGAHTDGLPATTTVPQADLELEALIRISAARDLLDHVLIGDVVPEPWTSGARALVERAERLLEVAI